MTWLDRVRAFDPNQPGPSMPEWATYIPSRSQPWKVHGKRAIALNAINQLRQSEYGLLFQWDERWILRASHIADDHREICELCQGTTRDIDAWSRHGDLGIFQWRRDKRGRILQPPELLYVCRDCERRFWV